MVFYIVVAIARFNVSELRHAGWLFDMGDTNEPWYHFYAYFGMSSFVLVILLAIDLSVVDLRNTSFAALWVTLPTQFALWVTISLHMIKFS